MNTSTINIEDILAGPFRSSPSGCDCTFIKLDDKWGLKLYKDEYTRDEAYENQRSCLDIDLAPLVGESIDFSSAGYYGYITEIIEPVAMSENDFNKVKYDADSRVFEIKREWEQRTEIERNIICKKIKEETGWIFYDSHYFNWGTKDGQLMPLDFG